MLTKICPDPLGAAATAVPGKANLAGSKGRFKLTYTRVSPDEPSCTAKKSLDGVSVCCIIIFTMARSPKPDPKLSALEESGTANPQAQKVQDPAFVASDFFDPRDLIQVRY